MNLRERSAHIFDRLNDIMAILAAAIIVFVMLAVAAEVTMRSFFDRTTTWVLEFSEYSLLFMTFLGAAWVLRRGRHVKMDVVLNLFGPKSRAFINFITSILCVIVCLVITWYSALVTWDYYQAGYYFSTPLETPKFIILVIIPVGSFTFLIQFLITAYTYLGEWKTLRKKQGILRDT